MLPILQLGPLAIQVPGLVMILGLWLGLSLAERFSPRHGVQPNQLYNLAFVALIAGVIGARLAFALRHYSAFASDPLGLLSLKPGMLDPWGGTSSTIIAASIYGQRKGLTFWATLDALVPAFTVLAVALGLSHLASGSAFGKPTSLPWGLELWGIRRHPAQIYDSLVAGVILALLWPKRNLVHQMSGGIYFLSFLALSSLARLFLEAYRGDSHLLLGEVRTMQVLAWLLLAVSLSILRRRCMASPLGETNTE